LVDVSITCIGFPTGHLEKPTAFAVFVIPSCLGDPLETLNAISLGRCSRSRCQRRWCSRSRCCRRSIISPTT